MSPVRPLVTIYVARIGLAVVAAAISTVAAIAFNQPGLNTFLNGVTIALLIYLLTYYGFKAKYKDKVEKQSKLMTQAIGMYFFTWLVLWVLMYTVSTWALGMTPA